MVEYNSIYKCRLCGEKFISFRGNKIYAESSMYRIFGNSESKTLEAGKHNCKDGSIGFADFLGFKKEKIKRVVNILFISESQNKSNKFLEKIKTDLENHGINGIEKDDKKCLIKTKYFTLKAVSIFDEFISLYCKNCEYIWMNFVGAEGERNPTIGQIMNCFSGGAKELRGEEELIEFLTEE